MTGIEALRKFGVYRLSSVIHRLRKQGYKIITDTILEDNVLYAEYFIRKEIV